MNSIPVPNRKVIEELYAQSAFLDAELAREEEEQKVLIAEYTRLATEAETYTNFINTVKKMQAYFANPLTSLPISSSSTAGNLENNEQPQKRARTEEVQN